MFSGYQIHLNEGYRDLSLFLDRNMVISVLQMCSLVMIMLVVVRKQNNSSEKIEFNIQSTVCRIELIINNVNEMAKQCSLWADELYV